jgi:LAGLIDADG DNA endonuclease family protein
VGLRGPKPKDTIDTAWSSDLAYCVGLIATDGCLYKDGRHISFTSADIQLVTLFKKLLKLPNNIGYKLSGSSQRRCPHIQFGNVIFYNWLTTIGLTPRKSLTIGPLVIPENHFMDFVRGCFDGDGSIYSYMDPRWPASHMFYISFASASKPFVDWLRDQVRSLLGISGHITPGNRNTYQLRYAKQESLVLLEKMYYNTFVPHLERKREKSMEIVARHRYISAENKRARVH